MLFDTSAATGGVDPVPRPLPRLPRPRPAPVAGAGTMEVEAWRVLCHSVTLSTRSSSRMKMAAVAIFKIDTVTVTRTSVVETFCTNNMGGPRALDPEDFSKRSSGSSLVKESLIT